MEVTITLHALWNGVIPRQSSTRYWGYSWVVIYYILGVLFGHHILYIGGTLGASGHIGHFHQVCPTKTQLCLYPVNDILFCGAEYVVLIVKKFAFDILPLWIYKYHWFSWEIPKLLKKTNVEIWWDSLIFTLSGQKWIPIIYFLLVLRCRIRLYIFWDTI